MSTAITTWTVPALRDVLIAVLAKYLGTTPAALAAELAAVGPTMPVDSMDLFDVLPEFWNATGLKIPTKNLRRSTMRSVDAFVTYVAAWGSK
ncbi:MAG TPA: hypothetical protein VK662_12975 [Acidothermaceae bacterium]|nr:hypothetical protein [Acidothermaceae bacterium]